MDTGDNDGNFSEGATGAQPTPASAIYGNVIASARQLQQAISSFAQEAGGSQERIIALLQNSGGEPNGEDAGAQTAPAGINSGIFREAARELQESVSRFAQGNQRIHENLSRGMDRPSDQLREVKHDIAEVRKATESNRDLIRNYRNW